MKDSYVPMPWDAHPSFREMDVNYIRNQLDMPNIVGKTYVLASVTPNLTAYLEEYIFQSFSDLDIKHTYLRVEAIRVPMPSTHNWPTWYEWVAVKDRSNRYICCTWIETVLQHPALGLVKHREYVPKPTGPSNIFRGEPDLL